MSIRGIFDGGGVRKQCGHWQSSLKGKVANGIFHFNSWSDFFFGPYKWKKFNYGDAININRNFHFELVRTGQDDWNDYLGGVGIFNITTNFTHLSQPKIVEKPDGGFYRITRSGDEGATYIIGEYDANSVILNKYELDIISAEIRPGEINYQHGIPSLISTMTGAKTYHIDLTAVYHQGQYCSTVEHTPYVNGHAGTKVTVYEPITSSNEGTLVLTPDPYMYSSSQRFVNGGGAKMVSGSWPASFDMNINLQLPALNTQAVTLYNELVSLIDIPVDNSINLGYYAEETDDVPVIKYGHFVTKVYIS